VTRLLILVVSIAIADSANPATLGPALYLATVERPLRRVSEFAAAFLMVNLVAGVVIVAGPGELLLAAISKPGGTARNIIELAVGMALIALGLVLLAGRERAGELAAAEPNLGSRGAWSLGAAIAAAELPTAVPYFATLAAIIGSGLSLANQLVLVAIFNVVFILPLLVLFTLRRRLPIRAGWEGDGRPGRGTRRSRCSGRCNGLSCRHRGAGRSAVRPRRHLPSRSTRASDHLSACANEVNASASREV